MSMRISASAEPKMFSASFFARYVFPTPVGPRNMKAPMGWLGSLSPILLRWMAFTTFSIALSCATTSPLSVSPILRRRALSVSVILSAGIPAITDTTLATSSSVTSTTLLKFPSLYFCSSSFIFCCSSVCLSRKLAASSKFWFLTAFCFFLATSAISFSVSVISGGTCAFCRCALAPASSRASIALSGNCLSVTYLSVYATHAFIASSEYLTAW